MTPELPAELRRAIRLLIDKRRRELAADDGLPPQGNHGRLSTYKRGCRCEHCRAVSVAAKRRWREEHPGYERDYTRRRRHMAAAKAELPPPRWNTSA